MNFPGLTVKSTYSESKDMTNVIPTNHLNTLQNPITAFSSFSSSGKTNKPVPKYKIR